jgi:O-antigen/teichoic acid export membrane protein
VFIAKVHNIRITLQLCNAAAVMRNYKSWLHHTMVMIVGTALGQIISVASIPIISRLYSPQMFGEQAALLSIIAPLVTIASMAFPIAIVLADNKRQVNALAYLSTISTTAVGIIAFFALSRSDYWLLSQLGLTSVADYVYIIPIWATLISINMCATQYLLRNENFVLSAQLAAMSSLIGNLGKIGLGAIIPSTFTLIIGNIIIVVLTPIVAILHLRQRLFFLRPPTLKYGLETFYKFREFALYRAPQNAIAAASQSIPIFALSAFYGPSSAGYFAMSLALLSIPVTLIGNSVQSVLYPKFVQEVRSGKRIFGRVVVSTIALITLGVVALTPVTIIPQRFYTLLLGNAWADLAPYTVALIPSLIMGLANRPVVSVMPIFALQRHLLLYELCSTTAKFVAVAIAVKMNFTPEGLTLAFATANALFYAILISLVILYLYNRKIP